MIQDDQADKTIERKVKGEDEPVGNLAGQYTKSRRTLMAPTQVIAGS